MSNATTKDEFVNRGAADEAKNKSAGPTSEMKIAASPQH